MTPEKQVADNDAPVLRMRHNRFDGFDIYTVEIQGRKILFHKDIVPKPIIIGGVFKLLGVNDNLWLCENLDTKMIHVGPEHAFVNAPIPDQGKKPAKPKEPMPSASPLETEQSA